MEICRALVEWLLERFAELADMRILRSAEARLRTSAAGVQQTAMYSVQAEFGLLAASLYCQLDPTAASKYTVLREMTIGETLHTLPCVKAALQAQEPGVCSCVLMSACQRIYMRTSMMRIQNLSCIPHHAQGWVPISSGLSFHAGLQMMMAACGWVSWQRVMKPMMEQLCGWAMRF